MRRLQTLTLLLLACCAVALADPIVVDGTYQERVFEGGGRDFLITGHHNDVVINGSCGTVTLEGHHNDAVINGKATLIQLNGHHLDAQANSADEVIFNGHHNDATVTSGRPRVTDNGPYNDFHSSDGVTVQGSSDSDSDAVVVNLAGIEKTYQADGRSFVINGTSNLIIIRGKANQVRVNGSANEVQLDQANGIAVTGLGNKITYRAGRPDIRNTGVSCEVIKRNQ